MKYTFLFLASICIMLSVWIKYALNEISALREDLSAAEGNNCILTEELKKRDENAVKVSQDKVIMEKLADEEKSKGGFDWNKPLPDDLISHKLYAD